MSTPTPCLHPNSPNQNIDYCGEGTRRHHTIMQAFNRIRGITHFNDGIEKAIISLVSDPNKLLEDLNSCHIDTETGTWSTGRLVVKPVSGYQLVGLDNRAHTEMVHGGRGNQRYAHMERELRDGTGAPRKADSVESENGVAAIRLRGEQDLQELEEQTEKAASRAISDNDTLTSIKTDGVRDPITIVIEGIEVEDGTLWNPVPKDGDCRWAHCVDELKRLRPRVRDRRVPTGENVDNRAIPITLQSRLDGRHDTIMRNRVRTTNSLSPRIQELMDQRSEFHSRIAQMEGVSTESVLATEHEGLCRVESELAKINSIYATKTLPAIIYIAAIPTGDSQPVPFHELINRVIANSQATSAPWCDAAKSISRACQYISISQAQSRAGENGLDNEDVFRVVRGESSLDRLNEIGLQPDATVRAIVTILVFMDVVKHKAGLDELESSNAAGRNDRSEACLNIIGRMHGLSVDKKSSSQFFGKDDMKAFCFPESQTLYDNVIDHAIDVNSLEERCLALVCPFDSSTTRTEFEQAIDELQPVQVMLAMLSLGYMLLMGQIGRSTGQHQRVGGLEWRPDARRFVQCMVTTRWGVIQLVEMLQGVNQWRHETPLLNPLLIQSDWSHADVPGHVLTMGDVDNWMESCTSPCSNPDEPAKLTNLNVRRAMAALYPHAFAVSDVQAMQIDLTESGIGHHADEALSHMCEAVKHLAAVRDYAHDGEHDQDEHEHLGRLRSSGPKLSDRINENMNIIRGVFGWFERGDDE